MDLNRAQSLIEWMRWFGEDFGFTDIQAEFYDPLMEAFGEDLDEILEFLRSLDDETLLCIDGCFEDIYKKWTTEEVWNELEGLEQKIAYLKT